ncbi:hypothetical protein V9L05_21620 (plasmid) [Bernardetia sp. Wsw4-3y2]|uniref:hypothetical protein n=1 Tax=Bernardetia sp. Wsw4-3y2 TaxID=3127471 RepID=UPI0030D049FD
MNTQSKYSITYQFILFITTSLFIFSACGDSETETPKPDYKSLIIGKYAGEIDFGSDLVFKDTATVSAGSVADEIIFTYKLSPPDSSITLKLQLVDINSYEGVALRIPEQTVNSIQVAGIAINDSDVRGRQGYFFYQDEKDQLLNEIIFKVTADGLTSIHDFKKIEE